MTTTAAIETTTTVAKCCKCDRPAELRFVWPWGAPDGCCSIDRLTVTNNFASLGGPPPKFEELNPAPPAPLAAELDTVPPPNRLPSQQATQGGLPHTTGEQQAGAAVVATSTGRTALPEGTIALVSITQRGGLMRFLLRRPGQGDIDGSVGELAVVLQTLGLIPTAGTTAPAIVQQSGPGLPPSAAHALANAGPAQRLQTAGPHLAPPPPIRPPTSSNPLFRDRETRKRVAGRHPVQLAPGLLAGGSPEIGPALAPGDTETAEAAQSPAATGSPPPAPAVPPVPSAPTGGETTSVVEGEADEPPPTNPTNRRP